MTESAPAHIEKRHGRAVRGIEVPSHKSASTQLPLAPAPIPSEVIVPLEGGLSARDLRPAVESGQRVQRGQPLVQGGGPLSTWTHASTSGVVRSLERRRIAHPRRREALCAVIEADGKDERWPELARPDPTQWDTPEKLASALSRAGLSGLGGAVFPTGLKLSAAGRRRMSLVHRERSGMRAVHQLRRHADANVAARRVGRRARARGARGRGPRRRRSRRGQTRSAQSAATRSADARLAAAAFHRDRADDVSRRRRASAHPGADGRRGAVAREADRRRLPLPKRGHRGRALSVSSERRARHEPRDDGDGRCDRDAAQLRGAPRHAHRGSGRGVRRVHGPGRAARHGRQHDGRRARARRHRGRPCHQLHRGGQRAGAARGRGDALHLVRELLERVPRVPDAAGDQRRREARRARRSRKPGALRLHRVRVLRRRVPQQHSACRDLPRREAPVRSSHGARQRAYAGSTRASSCAGNGSRAGTASTAKTAARSRHLIKSGSKPSRRLLRARAARRRLR